MNRKQQHDLAELLEKSGLRKTTARIKVLEILGERDSATSQPFLEKALGTQVDRVTLYRILQAFEEKGIIHRVLDLEGTANFGLCTSACSSHIHNDQHLHFNCTSCRKVYCLDAIQLPVLQTPKGFQITDISVIASGLCASCAQVRD